MTTDHTPGRLMNRREAAAFLAERYGIRTTEHGLACHASRGTGPAFCRFGKAALYRQGDLIAWIEAGLTPAAASTSEHKAARRAGR